MGRKPATSGSDLERRQRLVTAAEQRFGERRNGPNSLAGKQGNRTKPCHSF
jgi:hypothetical protein